MARTSTYPLVDRALGGTLDTLLKEWREEGLSLADISYRLRSDHDIKVSANTIGRWLKADAA